jgi:hypothetical protein
MLTKAMARWILGGVSKETARWILGGLLLIPAVIVPIIVVMALILGMRKVPPLRKYCILNLLAASGLTLLILPGAVFHRNFSWFLWSIELSFALGWLFCAIGLFSRNRLAWCGSILCVGALFCLLAAGLGVAVPTLIHLKTDLAPSGHLLVGYVLSTISCLTWLGLALTASTWLLFGLLRIARDIFGGRTTLRGSAPQPPATAPPVCD